MSSSILENARLLHEELEKNQHKLVLKFLEKPKTHKEIIQHDHVIKAHVDRYTDAAKKLIDIYQDNDKRRKEELEEISGVNALNVFTTRVKETRDYHRRYPQAAAFVFDQDIQAQVNLSFTGEEQYGKYLDLHQFHERYINMSQFKRVDYVTFLSQFYYLSEIDRNKKTTPDYKKFIEDLLKYLKEFRSKVHPLVSQDVIDKLIREEFSAKWDKKELTGWFDDDNKQEELYCKVCDQRFTKSTVMTSHLTSQKHLKRQQNQSATPDLIAQKKRQIQQRHIALVEFEILHYSHILRPQIQATQQHIEQKQTLTYEEIEAENRAFEMAQQEEAAATAAADDEEDEDDEKMPYNPHNVPLGWDGKPIPYWLYKLHGLNLEFKCEICGHFSYWGPRAFQRHFTEARHTFGLKCLGITNTKHFQNVTNIADAVSLNDKLKKMSNELSYRAEDEEEFEDQEGNVFNKKTYHMLKKQGLI